MLNINLLQKLLIVSMFMSIFTCTFIQRTKKYFKRSSVLLLYNLIVNMIFGIIFCNSFTDIKFPDSLWIGLFSFLGADSIYKSLEGKIASHKDLI